ncbi:unnamed protein product [Effrenium voratum]|uniref:Uncharacterized protein n=1 Tax=Effrenium voratum TaxID=2562239 RepID=A0AA36IVW3_9DINO|nr:unnamed protein product [Effrenium voratum]
MPSNETEAEGRLLASNETNETTTDRPQHPRRSSPTTPPRTSTRQRRSLTPATAITRAGASCPLKWRRSRIIWRPRPRTAS